MLFKLNTMHHFGTKQLCKGTSNLCEDVLGGYIACTSVMQVMMVNKGVAEFWLVNLRRKKKS